MPPAAIAVADTDVFASVASSETSKSSAVLASRTGFSGGGADLLVFATLHGTVALAGTLAFAIALATGVRAEAITAAYDIVGIASVMVVTLALSFAGGTLSTLTLSFAALTLSFAMVTLSALLQRTTTTLAVVAIVTRIVINGIVVFHGNVIVTFVFAVGDAALTITVASSAIRVGVGGKADISAGVIVFNNHGVIELGAWLNTNVSASGSLAVAADAFIRILQAALIVADA